jgi:hypothetical protein
MILVDSGGWWSLDGSVGFFLVGSYGFWVLSSLAGSIGLWGVLVGPAGV